MSEYIYQKALSKIPEVVKQLCEYNGIQGMDIKQTITKYNCSGTVINIEYHLCDIDDLYCDIRKAKILHCIIKSVPDKVTIKRYLSSGNYYIAEYEPINN